MDASEKTAQRPIPTVYVSPSSTLAFKEIGEDKPKTNSALLSPDDCTAAGSLDHLLEKEILKTPRVRASLKRQNACSADETHYLSPGVSNVSKSAETISTAMKTKKLELMRFENSATSHSDHDFQEQPSEGRRTLREHYEPSNERLRIYSSVASGGPANNFAPSGSTQCEQVRPGIKRSKSSCLSRSTAETRVSFASVVDPVDTRKSWSPKQGEVIFPIHGTFTVQASKSSLDRETGLTPAAASTSQTAEDGSLTVPTESEMHSSTKCLKRRHITTSRRSKSASHLSPVVQPLLGNQRSNSTDERHTMSVSRDVSFEKSEAYSTSTKRSFLSLLSPSRILSFFKQSTDSLPSQSSCRKSRRKQIDHPEDHKIVTINVSGRRFRINDYFLSIHPETLLGNKGRYFYYDEDKDEYFFDRDPDSFRHIWNFYHTGELHCPQDECLDAFADEMKYFGLSETDMCCFCWSDVFTPNITQLTNERKEREMDEERKEMSKRALGPDKTARQRLWATFQDPSISFQAKVLYISSAILILVSVLANAVETIPCSAEIRVCKEENEKEYFLVDSVCVGLFTLEYLVKLYACPSRLEFMKNFMSVIDLLAILPYYADLVLNSIAGQSELGMDVFVTLRVLRILRVFKLLRNSKRLQKLTNSFRSSASDLGMVMFIYVLTVILFSSVIYFAETNTNPQIGSIPDGLWYAVVTTTTTG